MIQQTAQQSTLIPTRCVEFTVFGRPRPQAQNRTVPLLRKGLDGKMHPVMRMTSQGNQVPVTIHPNPRDTVNWRSDVKAAALAVFDGSHGLLQGPLRMDVTIFVERPKRLIWKSAGRPMPAIPTTSGPDRSNVLKSLEDALQGVVYPNDNQLADGRCRKFYCAGPGHGDPRPRVEVTVEEIR